MTTVMMGMIMPPPPVANQFDEPEFRDTTSSESMSPEMKIVPEETLTPDCGKEGENAIQKLLAESTAAIVELSAATDPTVEVIARPVHQEDDLVSSPPMTTDNVVQHPPSRPSPYPGVNQILPSLFLCSAAAARVNIIEHLKISLVINLAPELIVDTPLPSNPKPIYLRIPVLDKGNVDLKQFFDETCDLMEDVRQSGGKTLIHCVAGVSRSAAICVAYLMKYEKMSLKDAFKHVKLARPQIRPNCGFFRQLMAYELELTGVQTVHWVIVESIGQEVPDVYEPEYKAMEQFYQRHRHRHVRRRD